MKPGTERRTFILKLRVEPGIADPTRALRGALKLLLRQFGLRCVDVHEEQTK